MSTSTRPAWSDDCFKPAPERHYKGKRPSRRLVVGNSARTTSVTSIVTQEGVHADEAADWLGLGRRRDPALPPPATRSLREALEASAAPTQHAAGQTTARKSMREPAERYQRELPPPPVAPSEPGPLALPPPPPRRRPRVLRPAPRGGTGAGGSVVSLPRVLCRLSVVICQCALAFEFFDATE